jgi:hypothetical protein
MPNSQEGSDRKTTDEVTVTGPDANPNAPGHEDGSNAQGGEESHGDGEVSDAQG